MPETRVIDYEPIVNGLRARGFVVFGPKANGDYETTTEICHGGNSARKLSFGPRGIKCLTEKCAKVELRTLLDAAGIRPSSPSPHSRRPVVLNAAERVHAVMPDCSVCGAALTVYEPRGRTDDTPAQGYPAIACANDGCAVTLDDHWRALTRRTKVTFGVKYELRDGRLRREYRIEPEKKRYWEVGFEEGANDGAHAAEWHTRADHDRAGCQLVWSEGGKAASALVSSGICALTSASASADFTRQTGRRVVIWADTDDTGRRKAGRAASALESVFCDLAYADVSKLPPKSDAADVSRASARELVGAASSIRPHDIYEAAPAPEPREPYLWENPSEELWTQTQEADIARLLQMFPERLLVVDGGANEWQLLVDGGNGVWQRRDALRQKLLGDMRRTWSGDAEMAADDGQIDAKLLARVRGWRDSKAYHIAHKSAFSFVGAVYLRLLDLGLLPEKLTYSTPDQLDANPRYIGAPNGVIDLDADEGEEPLTGARARACLVTRMITDAFVLDAAHSDVDKLFAHLESDAREYLTAWLGFALRGQPSRRIGFLFGPPGGGKTTILNAIDGALGAYSGNAPDGALTDGASRPGPRPELEMVTRRILVSSDPTAQLDVEMLKRISGGDVFGWRDKYANTLREAKSTATLFFASNYGRMPSLPMDDDGMRERIYRLNIPAVEHADRDAGLGERLSRRRQRQALAALLVRYARRHKQPPADIPSVAEDREFEVERAIGDAGKWTMENIEQLTGAFLASDDMWRRALDDDDDSDSQTAFGLSRRAFSQQAQRLRGMGKSVTRRVEAKKVRGWTGFRLKPRIIEVKLFDTAEPKGLLYPAQIAQSQNGSGLAHTPMPARQPTARRKQYVCAECGELVDTKEEWLAHTC